MKTLTLFADHNEPGRKDSTGAFEPEAKAFHRLHGGTIHAFDNSLAEPFRRSHVRTLIDGGPYDAIAIFCHGYRRGLQTGHTMLTAHELAEDIARVSGDHVVVALYACSTAGKINVTRGGFADALRDHLTRTHLITSSRGRGGSRAARSRGSSRRGAPIS